jgi:NAD(P)-dependent dehydrogenase (short-subunit alcohol dehydrogenase family)
MADDLFSVSGQVVLVSGASRGIGKAIAQGFAERGAKVVITGRDAETLAAAAVGLQAGDAQVTGIVCDVGDSASILKLVDRVMEEHGRIDTLLNVAGVNRRMPAEQLREDDFDFILDINLKGAFLMSQSVGVHMLAAGRGCQINIGSLNNDRPLVGVLPYAISKAGLAHMTRTLAAEWGPRGVRVNTLAPGFILTDLTRKLWSQPKMYDWGISNTPLRRLGQAEDMVGTAVFLASAAAAFLTGQIIYVDGGFSAGLYWPIDFERQ